MDKNKILIPYDLMSDMDFGLIKLIQKEYRSDIFDRTVLDGDDEYIKSCLIRRTNPNPLSILTDDGNIDEYYRQFMERQYMDIFRLSRGTSIGVFCVDLLSFSDFELYIQYDKNDIDVVCARYLEKSIDSPYVHSICKSDVVPSDYMSIFAKNVADLTGYKDLNGVNIYLARYGFNLCMDDGNEILANPVYSLLFMTNELKCIDVYKGIMLYDDLETDNDYSEEDVNE